MGYFITAVLGIYC